MRFYFSTNLEPAQKRALDAFKARRLLAYTLLMEAPSLKFSWSGRESVKKYLDSVVEQDVELMLDSGAYSAWSRGVTIDLEEYAKFILARPEAFDVVVGLDVIPGSPKVALKITEQEKERAAQQGYENWLALKKMLKPAGIHPVHTYHRGEKTKWLEKIIEETPKDGIVGIGGARLGTTDEKIAWLDSIMPILCDDKGRPRVRFHGFAATSLRIMSLYPWWSVDSTSWVMTGRFGACFIPLPGKPEPGRDFYVNAKGETICVHKVVFSQDSPSKTEDGKHFDSYPKAEKQVIEAYLESKGTNRIAVAESYMARDPVNIEFFADFERSLGDRIWRRKGTQVSGFNF